MKNASVWNALTVAALALTVAVVVCFGAIFVNPQVFFNPLKPQTLTVLQLPTPATGATDAAPTSALVFPTFPPEWTATPTGDAPTPTRTRPPTAEPTATQEATVVHPLGTGFPSPVGPTSTRTPLPPTATATRTNTPQPPVTATPRSYPEVPGTPGGYP